MLVIRHAQFEALADSLRQRFRAEMVEYLCARYPQQFSALDEAARHALIDKGFACAARHGITLFGDVAVVIEVLVLRPDFEEAREPEELADVLTSKALPGYAKAEWLRRIFLPDDS